MQSLYCSHGHENPLANRFCSQCGEKLNHPVNQEPQASRYRVIRELGHGGFGRTYLAEDLNRFNEPCVLKEFAPQVQGTHALQKAAELFEREAGVLYKLQHPQIPKFRELFRVKQQNQGRLFLVQDFVAGQTYRALLDVRKQQGLRFTEVEVIELLRQILPVLGYIHSLGVIHRDISPNNLMRRDRDGLPVLIDFGGVKQVAATVASHFMPSSPAIATRLGKFGYAPHEQMQSGMIYPNSDLYALAATALTLLTGKEPQQLIDSPTLTWNWQQEITLSPTLSRILAKMLQSVPEARYQTAGQVLQALTPQPPPVAYSPPQPPFPQTQATVAVTPGQIPAQPEASSSPSTETSSWNSTPPLGWLGKLMLVLVLIVGAGGFGWWAGNLWIKSQIQQQPQNEEFENPTFSSDNNSSEAESSSEFSSEEQQRKQTLRQQRINLGIDYNIYVALVNEVFWNQYPEQRGKQLGTGSEDEKLREEWDAIATNLLTQIEELDLSGSARQQIGNYGEEDRDRFKAQANELHISSRSLYDLADAKFFKYFPEQQGKDFLNQPFGQLWHAIISDTLKALKSGDSLKQIVFESGTTSKQLSGILKSGEGKVFIAELSEGQTMKVNLSTDENALFSIYSPTGNTKLMEDSRDREWSGLLPESGYYEFAIVSNSSEPIDYQLELTVEDESLE